MKRSRLVFNLTRAISSLILLSRFEVQTQGLGHLPEKGPAFLIPKHQQWWDVPLLGHVVPRPLYFLAKQELFRSSLGRYFISRLGGIPVDRESPIRSLATFRALVSLLRQEAFLVLFPEGTYYPGAMGPGKWRLVQLILRLQNKQALRSVPFIPVGIGYERLSGSSRTRVIVRLGEPLQEPDPCRAEDFTAHLLSRIKELSGLQIYWRSMYLKVISRHPRRPLSGIQCSLRKAWIPAQKRCGNDVRCGYCAEEPDYL